MKANNLLSEHAEIMYHLAQASLLVAKLSAKQTTSALELAEQATDRVEQTSKRLEQAVELLGELERQHYHTLGTITVLTDER